MSGDSGPSASVQNGKVVVRILRVPARGSLDFFSENADLVYGPDPEDEGRWRNGPPPPTEEEIATEALRCKLLKLQFENGTLRMPRIETFPSHRVVPGMFKEELTDEDGTVFFANQNGVSTVAGDIARRVIHPRALKL